MTVLAHASSGVAPPAHASSLASAAGVAVARAAMSAATVLYLLASSLETDSSSASLPNTLPVRAIVSLGKPEPGSVVSPSRSRATLLYSKRVRRRTSALPGCTPWHCGEVETTPVPPGPPGPPPPVVLAVPPVACPPGPRVESAEQPPSQAAMSGPNSPSHTAV